MAAAGAAPGAAPGVEGTPSEPRRQYPFAGSGQETADKLIDGAFMQSNFVRFMLEKMAASGCKVGREFFSSTKCDTAKIAGGFMPGAARIIVCNNYVTYSQEVATLLTHELIHAYDQCRAANMNWASCEQHACSEIRAANLSGDCTFIQEAMRGHFVGFKGHQQCVRRRALLSIGMNPNCGRVAAAAAVDKVFATCYADTSPFERIP